MYWHVAWIVLVTCLSPVIQPTIWHWRYPPWPHSHVVDLVSCSTISGVRCQELSSGGAGAVCWICTAGFNYRSRFAYGNLRSAGSCLTFPRMWGILSTCSSAPVTSRDKYISFRDAVHYCLRNVIELLTLTTIRRNGWSVDRNVVRLTGWLQKRTTAVLDDTGRQKIRAGVAPWHKAIDTLY